MQIDNLKDLINFKVTWVIWHVCAFCACHACYRKQYAI